MPTMKKKSETYDTTVEREKCVSPEPSNDRPEVDHDRDGMGYLRESMPTRRDVNPPVSAAGHRDWTRVVK